jgi:hypothetical protein
MKTLGVIMLSVVSAFAQYKVRFSGAEIVNPTGRFDGYSFTQLSENQFRFTSPNGMTQDYRLPKLRLDVKLRVTPSPNGFRYHLTVSNGGGAEDPVRHIFFLYRPSDTPAEFSDSSQASDWSMLHGNWHATGAGISPGKSGEFLITTSLAPEELTIMLSGIDITADQDRRSQMIREAGSVDLVEYMAKVIGAKEQVLYRASDLIH